jgi:hypothetical protein
MNDLSDDAKALFDAARPGHEPTQQDREQVRTRLLIRIAGAAATLGVAQTGAAASLGPGAAMASGAKTLLALKLIVGLTIAGGAQAHRGPDDRRGCRHGRVSLADSWRSAFEHFRSRSWPDRRGDGRRTKSRAEAARSRREAGGQ